MKIHWKKKVVFGMRCGLKNPYQVAYQIDGSKRMVNCKNCLRSKAPPDEQAQEDEVPVRIRNMPVLVPWSSVSDEKAKRTDNGY